MTNELDIALSTGDQSGRPDISGVDPAIAEDYARRMFDAVRCVRFDVCKNLHIELNKDCELYTASLDAFRKICHQRGVSRAAERWREYSHD